LSNGIFDLVLPTLMPITVNDSSVFDGNFGFPSPDGG
jgi:hypothetical protein